MRQGAPPSGGALVYAAAMLVSVLLAAMAAAPHGVAVERATGRVGVWRGGEITILAADLRHAVAAVPAPPGPVELMEFAGGVVTYAFALPEDGSPARAAVGVGDGIERLIWPNSGIGERFPSHGARLTADGQGIFEFAALDARLRSQLGLGEDIPDGAGTVVTYRFADEQVWAIAAADFAGAMALSPADALVVTAGGDLMRYRSPVGVVWRQRGEEGRRIIQDVDPANGIAVVSGERGVETVAVDSGESRGSWPRGGVNGARLLADGRLLASTQDGEVWVVTLGSRGATAVPLAQLTGGEWPSGAAPCSPRSGPLACLHPAPGGVIVPAGAGWRLLPLSPSGGRGGAVRKDRSPEEAPADL